MASRMSPWMWPVLALASPVVVPKLLRRNQVFKQNRSRAEKLNRERIDQVQALELPQLDFLMNLLQAYHGAHGIWLAITEKPDLVITDLKMPQGEGQDVVECLRTTPTQAISPWSCLASLEK